MNFKYITINLILFFSISYCSKIIDRTESEINNYFPNLISLDWKIHKIKKQSSKNIQNRVKQKFFRKEVNTWMIVNDDSSKFYAVLDNVKGKSLPITFLSIYNSDLRIIHVSIIKYREAYGGEIRNQSWLNQFITFNDLSNYKVGNKISSISGATISVNSISKGMRKLSMLIDEIIIDFNE